MDACTSFCATLSTTVGPSVANYVLLAGVAALTWWNARKSKAGVKNANAKVADIQVQLAAVQAVQSLRPSAPAPVPVVLGTVSSQSGNFEPVRMPELHPSTPTPETIPAFPPPPRMPSESAETSRETPYAKRQP